MKVGTPSKPNKLTNKNIPKDLSLGGIFFQLLSIFMNKLQNIHQYLTFYWPARPNTPEVMGTTRCFKRFLSPYQTLQFIAKLKLKQGWVGYIPSWSNHPHRPPPQPNRESYFSSPAN